MNAIQVRKVNVPLTPNIQEYKQKNKSKSRRKPCAIQPTNPPTPKMHKPHIHLKLPHDKHLDTKQQPTFAAQHNDKTAVRFAEHPQKKKVNNAYPFHDKYEEADSDYKHTDKKKELDQFRKTIKNFGLRLQDAQSTLHEWGYSNEQHFFQRKVFIEESFNTLKEDLQEKKTQLLGLLIQGHKKIKQSMNDRWRGMEDMRNAITRYLKDIQNNYEQIIQDLSLDQFEEIMEKYNSKIVHFQKNVQHYLTQMGMNIYIPVREIQKYMSKSHLYLYPQFELQQMTTMTYNKTMNRYPTEKTNLYIDSQKNMTSQALQSIGKMGQHRQSRDREFFNIYRPNKENFNGDNHNYR